MQFDVVHRYLRANADPKPAVWRCTGNATPFGNQTPADRQLFQRSFTGVQCQRCLMQRMRKRLSTGFLLCLAATTANVPTATALMAGASPDSPAARVGNNVATSPFSG